MANDPKPTKKAGAKTFTQEDLERELDKRLKRERAKYSDYDELKAKADKFDKSKDDGKSGDEKLTEKLDSLEKDLASERQLRMRAEVAAAKGLTPAQAKRLSGNTQEELEADADELLESFPAPSKDDGDTGPARGKLPSQRPKPDLRGGGDPTEDEPTETDPAKLAAGVPRF